MMKRTVLAPVIVLLFLSALANGDHGTSLVFDANRAKGYITYLSSDAFEGRMTCTDGYRKAADWVAGQFRSWGLKPAGENGTYFQELSIRGFDWNTGVPALTIKDREFLFDDKDFAVLPPSTPGTTHRVEVVFVGYGISAPDKGLDEYQGLDVRGKIVLVLTGSPKDAPPLRQMFSSGEQAEKKDEKQEEWKEESADLAKIKTAYDKGAAAVLLFNPDESPDGSPPRSSSSGSSGQPTLEPERNFLCLAIRERVFREIMKRDPQLSPQGLKRQIDHARREIQKKNSQSRPTGVMATVKGYDVSMRYDEQHGNNTAQNVLAKIEGTDPDLKNEYVMVGAHLDHVGMRGGYVYNGADDNASGSGVVLELARVMAEGNIKPKRTLIFCCWTGEEKGLLGSNHFAKQPCDGVTMDRIAAHFNLDMVGMGEQLNASGALNFPSVWDVIRRGQDPEIMKRLKPSEGGPGGSDHSAFIVRGIETMMLISTGGVGHQDYHQPEDDSGKIEPEMLRTAGQFVLQGMLNLADETEVKLLVDRRQEIYRALRMSIKKLNPELSDSQWTRVSLEADSNQALRDKLHKQSRELARGVVSAKPPKKALSRGLPGPGPIGDDSKLLELVIDFYGIGRLDIEKDDGTWVRDGRLTEAGKECLQTLESNGVMVRLISPSTDLVDDFLSAASKPFVITGNYEVNRTLAERLSRAGVQLGIDLDPKNVGAFLSRVEQLKGELGERKNLFVYLIATEELEASRKPLYLGLVDRGWAHNEICGSRDHGGLIGGASLEYLYKEGTPKP